VFIKASILSKSKPGILGQKITGKVYGIINQDKITLA
jgi:hypothetical protein